MGRRIAQSFAIGLVLFMIAGGVDKAPLSNDGTCWLPPEASAAVGIQDAQPRKPGRNQRCVTATPPGCARAGGANNPPDLRLEASAQKIILPCGGGATPQGCTPSESQQVQLRALASDADGDTVRYSYSATGGRISGEGPNVTWDLTGLRPGGYTATAEVDDTCGCVAFYSVRVTVASCDGCGAADDKR
jgi:hypothetical protein